MCNENWVTVLLEVSVPLMSPEVYQDSSAEDSEGSSVLTGPRLGNETYLSVVCVFVIMEQGDTERTAFCIGYAVMPTVGRPPE